MSSLFESFCLFCVQQQRMCKDPDDCPSVCVQVAIKAIELFWDNPWPTRSHSPDMESLEGCPPKHSNKSLVGQILFLLRIVTECPHVARYVGVVEKGAYLFIVIELYPTNLAAHMSNQPGEGFIQHIRLVLHVQMLSERVPGNGFRRRKQSNFEMETLEISPKRSSSYQCGKKVCENEACECIDYINIQDQTQARGTSLSGCVWATLQSSACKFQSLQTSRECRTRAVGSWVVLLQYTIRISLY